MDWQLCEACYTFTIWKVNKNSGPIYSVLKGAKGRPIRDQRMSTDWAYCTLTLRIASRDTARVRPTEWNVLGDTFSNKRTLFSKANLLASRRRKRTSSKNKSFSVSISGTPWSKIDSKKDLARDWWTLQLIGLHPRFPGYCYPASLLPCPLLGVAMAYNDGWSKWLLGRDPPKVS